MHKLKETTKSLADTQSLDVGALRDESDLGNHLNDLKGFHSKLLVTCIIAFTVVIALVFVLSAGGGESLRRDTYEAYVLWKDMNPRQSHISFEEWEVLRRYNALPGTCHSSQ